MGTHPAGISALPGSAPRDVGPEASSGSSPMFLTNTVLPQWLSLLKDSSPRPQEIWRRGRQTLHRPLYYHMASSPPSEPAPPRQAEHPYSPQPTGCPALQNSTGAALQISAQLYSLLSCIKVPVNSEFFCKLKCPHDPTKPRPLSSLSYSARASDCTGESYPLAGVDVRQQFYTKDIPAKSNPTSKASKPHNIKE